MSTGTDVSGPGPGRAPDEGARALPRRFLDRLVGGGPFEPSRPLLVALSGGVDSVALLHLLRFAAEGITPPLVAAHLDHAMRPGSEADADWVRGLCRAWGIRLQARRLDRPPGNEAEARAVRYAFLEQVRSEVDAQLTLTGHHADDQAETVLFRAVRVGDPSALSGIAERRPPFLWRPMLSFTRAEVESYARDADLTWREDPTNREPLARNVIRSSVLPLLEARVAPGARTALVRLARRSAEDREAWASLTPWLLAQVGERTEEGGFSIGREPLLELHPGVRARVLRALADRVGATLSEAGTRLAVEFSSSGASGGEVSLPGGVRLRREFDRLLVVPEAEVVPDEPIEIPASGEGTALAVVGGRRVRVSWGVDVEGAGTERFALDGLRFPLRVRRWAPGDRIRFDYGTKKVKKVLSEARMPVTARRQVAVLSDADGGVLWVPGCIRSCRAVPAGAGEALSIRIVNDDVD